LTEYANTNKSCICLRNTKTVGEEIVSLHGHVTGLKKDISNLKNNQIKNLSDSVSKIEKKVDYIVYYLIAGMGALIITLISLFGQFIK
jgi:hypothetical protein